MYKKILVAVDGYDPSLGAAKRAIETAVQYGSEVVMIRVEEDFPSLQVEQNIDDASTIELQHKPLVEKPLELMVAYGQKHGVSVDARLEKGGITACILKVATDDDVDLIIIGDSGRKGLDKMYFGSVAQAVVEGASRPVLIIKKGSVDISDLLTLLPVLTEATNSEEVPLVFQPELFKQNFKFSFTLFIIFAVIYFGAALLTSAPMKEVAAMVIIGLPVAIWLGWGLIISGIVITRVYLSRA